MAWGRNYGTDEPEFPNFLHCFTTLWHTYFHYKQKGVIIFILKEPYPVALGKSHSLFLLRDKALEKDEVYFSKLVKHISEQWPKVSFILQWVITYNSDREVYYRSLDSSLTTLLKNTRAVIKLPSLHLCSQRKNEQAIYIYAQSTVTETQSSKSQVSSLVGFQWTVGNACLMQRRATRPGLLLSCPLPSPLKSFSSTSSIRVSFCFPVVGGCWGKQWFLGQFCHF